MSPEVEERSPIRVLGQLSRLRMKNERTPEKQRLRISALFCLMGMRVPFPKPWQSDMMRGNGSAESEALR